MHQQGYENNALVLSEGSAGGEINPLTSAARYLFISVVGGGGDHRKQNHTLTKGRNLIMDGARTVILVLKCFAELGPVGY